MGGMTECDSPFRDRSFSQRFETMGDPAEKQFERWATEVARLKYVRYGLDRPPIQMHRLPLMIRYTPDYLMSARLVEVKGFGRDQVLKLKLENLDALEEWCQHHPVSIFAWDSFNERAWTVDLTEITNAVAGDDFQSDVFPEGKWYFKIPAAWLAEHGDQVLGGTP